MMRTNLYNNHDRNRDPRVDEHDHYTQWLLDELGSDGNTLWPMGEQPDASNFVDVIGGNDASITGTWTLGNTPITWDGPDAADPDGSTGDAEIGDVADLDFGTGSFSVWGWTQTSTSGTRVIDKRSTSGWVVQIVSGGGYRLIVDSGDDSIDAIGTTSIDDGSRHFFCGTWDAGSSTVKIYTDGAEEASDTNASVGDIDSSDSCYIGSNQGASSFYDGDISMLGTATVALSATRIEKIYQRGVI